MNKVLVKTIQKSIQSLKSVSAKRESVRLKRSYDRMVGKIATKHYTHDATFYIVSDKILGYRAVKFFNDSSDYRVGAYHPSPSEAYSDALCWM